MIISARNSSIEQGARGIDPNASWLKQPLTLPMPHAPMKKEQSICQQLCSGSIGVER
jgi:hypothetical protein